MFHFIKTVHGIKYFLKIGKYGDQWEGLRENAGTFTYSEIVNLQNRLSTSEYSYIKA